MADEIFNPNYRYPGQSVPTPPAPIVSSDSMPLDNTPPDAPIIPVAGGGDLGNNGSIDPAADRVMNWWMSADTQAQHGPAVSAQFSPGSALYAANQASMRAFNAPFYMPSGALNFHLGKATLWSLVGAALGYALPPVGKQMGAKVGWGLAGFLFPTITTGAVAIRQVVK